MSRGRDLDKRLDALADIGKIMRSLKNLSFMETRRLAHAHQAQRRVVVHMEQAADELLAYDPGLLPAPASFPGVLLIIGAERGFCGSFNQELVRALGDGASGAAQPSLIAVGGRLAASLEGDARLADAVPGASTAEEVPGVLNRLVPVLNRRLGGRAAPVLRVLHWDAEQNRIATTGVLPPFQDRPPPRLPAHPFPPRLNLPAPRFLELLIEHYLFAALQLLLYGSLMAEQQHRLHHLEGASRRVEERMRALTLRRNVLRQEEITEEIELILLNLPAPEGPAT